MKRLLLFLLLLASIGCEKELAPQGEQKFKLSDFYWNGCGCEMTVERIKLEAEGSLLLGTSEQIRTDQDNKTLFRFTGGGRRGKYPNPTEGEVIGTFDFHSLSNGNCIYWLIVGDTAHNDAPNLVSLDIKGSLILGLGDTSRDEAMQNLNGCETQVLMRHGDGKYSDNVLTFTKKRVGSYLIRDCDIIESIDYNTLQTLPAIQAGTTDTDKYYDLEYNPTNNVSSRDGNRYYDRIKFANWPPKNYKYFNQ